MTYGHNYSYLKVVPSFVCSKGCFYCYNTLLGQKTPTSVDELLRQVAHMLNEATQEMTVELIGGEPLQPPTYDVTRKIIDLCANHPSCRGITLSTALASPRVLAEIADSLSLIYLSVDVSNRNDNPKKISMSRLRKIAEICREKDVQIVLSAVMYGDETPAMWREFFGEVSELEIEAVGVGHQTSTLFTAQALNDLVDQYYELFKLRLEMGKRLSIAGAVLDSMELYLLRGGRVAACECGRNSVAIEPDGRVVSGVCVDHSLEGSVACMDEQFRVSRENDLLRGPCGSCKLWFVCRGGCAYEGRKTLGSLQERALVQCEIYLALADRIEADLTRL